MTTSWRDGVEPSENSKFGLSLPHLSCLERPQENKGGGKPSPMGMDWDWEPTWPRRRWPVGPGRALAGGGQG